MLRRYSETRYGNKSWRCERRLAARIEATTKGLDIRFVVTSIAVGSAEWLQDTLYRARGQAENLVKPHKTQLASDRTSFGSPLANQVRLVPHNGGGLKLTRFGGAPQAFAGRFSDAQNPSAIFA